MKNEKVKNFMIENYNNLASTHNYIIGIKHNNNWCACFLENATNLLYQITTLDRSSSRNGRSHSLRFTPNKSIRELILQKASRIETICSTDTMEMLNKQYAKLNRGDIFEMLIAQKYNGIRPQLRNTCFVDCGDINIQGTEWQCKIEKSTWTNEQTLLNLLAKYPSHK